MRFTVVAVSAAGLIIGIAAALAVLPGVSTYFWPQTKNWTVGKATIGGPFEMVDHNGRQVSDQTFKGRYLLVFFGFTHCPDICPAALQTVTAALERMGPKADKIAPLFVSVDPERDTPEILKEYLSYFDARIIALTGSQEQVAKMVKTYRAYARKVPNSEAADDYTVDHSAFLYLMAPDGTFITHFSPTVSFEKMAERISREIRS